MTINGALVLWFAAIVGGIFYVFDSGQPQPADWVLALLVGMVLSGIFFPFPRYEALYATCGFLVSWIASVNLFYYALHGHFGFLMSAAYYVYNAGILIVVVMLAAHAPQRFRTTTMLALATAIVIEVMVVASGVGERARNTGTFNNPNQLGYWAILAGACWFVLKGERRLDGIDLVVILLVGYLAKESLSRAALGGFALLVISALLFLGIERRWRPAFIALAGLLVVAVLVNPELLQIASGIQEDVQARFDRKADEDVVATRAYYRILEFPEYLFLGAGEGLHVRFAADKASEIHSSWGTLLFAYGVVGVGAFLAMLGVVFWHAPWRYWLYFAPIAFYGLTHQGMRFSLMWVFLGLVFAASKPFHAGRATALGAAHGWRRTGWHVAPRGLSSQTGSVEHGHGTGEPDHVTRRF